jgi:hypothetical protein
LKILEEFEIAEAYSYNMSDKARREIGKIIFNNFARRRGFCKKRDGSAQDLEKRRVFLVKTTDIKKNGNERLASIESERYERQPAIDAKDSRSFARRLECL